MNATVATIPAVGATIAADWTTAEGSPMTPRFKWSLVVAPAAVASWSSIAIAPTFFAALRSELGSSRSKVIVRLQSVVSGNGNRPAPSMLRRSSVRGGRAVEVGTRSGGPLQGKTALCHEAAVDR